jgi:hypothetical protein
LLENKTATFEILVKRPLEQALTRMKRDESEAFQQNAIQMVPLGVNFVAVEKEELVLYNRRFKVNPLSNIGCIKIPAREHFSAWDLGLLALLNPQYLGQLMGFSS